VRLRNGGFAEVRISADSVWQAKQLAEAQYGAANVIAVVGEAR
jgi:hypothetical protein